MTYSKPQVVLLGDATVVVQGNKSLTGDAANHPIGVFDGELDD